MASVRTKPSNRLHEAAARLDGLAEVKRLIEIEKLDVNQLHTKDGTSAIAFAAETGSLDTVSYLLECKARIEQPKGKSNLLLFAAKEKQSPDVVKFITSLYKDFNDGTTELHVAVACRDFGRIEDIIISDANSIYVEDDHKNNSIKYASIFNYFDIAGFLLTHAEHASSKFQESLEFFLYEISAPEFSPEDKIKHRNMIFQIIPIIEPIKSARAQCSHYILLFLTDFFNSTQNKEEEYALVRKMQNLILSSTEPVLSNTLAWSLFNFAFDLKDEDRLKSLLWEVALQLMPNTETEIEHLFRSVVRTQLVLNQGIQSIQKLSNRVLTILDAKEEVKLKESYEQNSQSWLEEVIYPLMKDPTHEACEVVKIFLRLTLRIAPNDTPEDKNFIAKLNFIFIQNELKLRHHEEANRILREYKLETGVVLSDDAIDELILATAALAKNKNFDALMYARELSTHERFIESLKALILRGDSWNEILPLLEAFHVKGLIETFPPNTLIGGIPFIIHIAKANQYEILRFLVERTSVMSDSILTSSVPVVTGDTHNCTALYFVGVGGDFVFFKYLLERVPSLYHPEPTTVRTKPFIHALLDNAAQDFSKFSQYYIILEKVINKYPDEINKVWKGVTTIELLNKLHPSVKICLGPALRSREVKMQTKLESQIRREIINNEVIKPFLSGAEILTEVCFYQNRPEKVPIEGAVVLRENINMLDSLINPYSGAGWLRVSVSFYNTDFLPWKLKCDSDAACYGDDGLPVVEARNSMQAIKEINAIINLVHGYFTRSMKTSFLKSYKPSDLICHRDAVTNKEELVGELEQEAKVPMKYTFDTIHPASSSFLKMFKSRGKLKEDKIDEEIIGSIIHPAYR